VKERSNLSTGLSISIVADACLAGQSSIAAIVLKRVGDSPHKKNAEELCIVGHVDRIAL
jgi:hypothetical protein